MSRTFEAYVRGIIGITDVPELLREVKVHTGGGLSQTYFSYDVADFLSPTRKLVTRKRMRSSMLSATMAYENILEVLAGTAVLDEAEEIRSLYSESIQGNKRSRVVSTVSSNAANVLEQLGFSKEGSPLTVTGACFELKNTITLSLLRQKEGEFVVVEICCGCSEATYADALRRVVDVSGLLSRLVRFK